MAALTQTIGTGKDYTTIAAWEDYCDGDPNNQNTGYCEAEAFALVAFAGGTYTSTNYPHLTAKVGAQHDGRAHEVSAAGNARIEWASSSPGIFITDEFVRVSWMELKGPGNNQMAAVAADAVAACTIHVHHCVIHNNLANNNSGVVGFTVTDADATCYLYRNVIYGYLYGVFANTLANASRVMANTCYYNGKAATWSAGIRNDNSSVGITANACFANLYKDLFQEFGTTGVWDYNATSDGTGDDEGANGIANLVTANQFQNPTTTWAQTDLRIKAGAGLIDEGVDLTNALYPEIEYPITSRSTPVSGTWDIGADELAGAEPQHYEMPAVVGAFALSGLAAGLLAARLLTGGVGAFTETGQSVALLQAKTIPAAVGSFALTGQDVGALAARLVQPVAGAFALAGQAPGLLAARLAPAGVGAFTETGQAVGLLAARQLPAAVGAYALTGLPVDVLAARLLAVDAGAFVETGQAIGLLATRQIPAALGEFSLTGLAPNLLSARALGVSAGAFTETGQSAELLTARQLAAGLAAFAFDGQQAGLFAGLRLAPGAGEFLLGGQAAGLRAARICPADLAAFAQTGQAVALLTARQLAAAIGEFQLSGQNVDLTYAPTVNRPPYVLVLLGANS